VVGVATVAVHPEEARLYAKVLVAARADGALTASDPGIDEAHLSRIHPSCRRACRHHLADRFVPERQGHPNAAVLQRHPAAEAEIVAALPNVEITVANPGCSDPEQHLRSRRLGRPALDGLKRRAEIDHPIASHALPRGVPDPEFSPGHRLWAREARSDFQRPRSERAVDCTAEWSLLA
jgi:hypothetical protein